MFMNSHLAKKLRSARNKVRRAERRMSFETLEGRLPLASDMVLDWNEVMLDAVRQTNANPPRASRAMAIVHAAIYDSVNAIERTHAPYLVDTVAPPTASAEAAVAQAAHDTLVALFPNAPQVEAFATALETSLSAIADGPAEEQGRALGALVASQILALRAADGSSAVIPYTPGADLGDWIPTLPANALALLPGWGLVTPFAMTSGDQFRASPPAGMVGIPDMDSPEYAAAFDEVRLIGAADAHTSDRDNDGEFDRTADQTAIAHFWANGGGTATPPGHLNMLAREVSEARGLSLAENARLFAMLNVAEADAAIMCWDFKFAENYWRPITAIRAGDVDTNTATVGEVGWLPLIATPPFPTYTSGHSSFSGAAAAVLEAFFGSDPAASETFTLKSETAIAADRTFSPGIVNGQERTSYFMAAYESALSRLYGGIHWQFDNLDGLTTGVALGNYVAANFFQQVDRPADAQVVGDTLVVVGSNHSEKLTVNQTSTHLVVSVDGNQIGRFPISGITSILLDAGDGDDRVVFTPTVAIPVQIFGGQGNDTMRGGTGHDQVFGEEGNDFLTSIGGNDLLDGGDGDDVLQGNVGNDSLSGGDGNDSLSGWGGDDLLEGGDGNDELLGHDGNDTAIGGLGQDSLWGAQGNDVLEGGEDNDFLRGGIGDDLIDGGAGDDRLLGDAGNDTLLGGVGLDWLEGNAGNDTLDGGADADRLHGGEGDDELSGGAGADLLLGANGNDLLDGGEDDDSLKGGQGDDELTGGPGTDLLIGGIGSDLLDGLPG